MHSSARYRVPRQAARATDERVVLIHSDVNRVRGAAAEFCERFDHAARVAQPCRPEEGFLVVEVIRDAKRAGLQLPIRGQRHRAEAHQRARRFRQIDHDTAFAVRAQIRQSQ